MVASNDTSKSEKFYIYFLIDPRNEKVFYVGQTDNWNRRFKQHSTISHWENMFKNSPNPGCFESAYVPDMLKQGIQPALYVREEVYSRKDALIRERAWQIYFTENGTTLINVSRYKIEGLERNEHLPDNYESIKRVRIDKRYDKPLYWAGGNVGKVTQAEMKDIILNPSSLSIEELAHKYSRPVKMIESIIANHNRKKK